MAAAATTAAPVSVSDQPDYSCAICLEDLMINPVETNCKHLFCLYCIINWFERQCKHRCPCCRAYLREIKKKDKLQEEIENILLPALSHEERGAWEEEREKRGAEEWFCNYFKEKEKKGDMFVNQGTMQLVRATPEVLTLFVGRGRGRGARVVLEFRGAGEPDPED